MAEAPHAFIVSETPARLRLKIPTRRHDAGFFKHASHKLTEQRPAARVEVNPTTGSILIHAEDVRACLEALDRDGVLVLTEQPDSSPRFEQLRERMLDFNEWFMRITGGKGDARVYIFTLLIISAAYQAMRGEVFAPAATLLWYAGEALRVWKSPDNADDIVERMEPQAP